MTAKRFLNVKELNTFLSTASITSVQGFTEDNGFYTLLYTPASE